jgi:hypothetical protein
VKFGRGLGGAIEGTTLPILQHLCLDKVVSGGHAF